MNLLLMLLARCNASCGHCSEDHGPYRTEALRKDDIVRLMDEAAAIDDGEPLQFDLTGGEPFLDFELLTAIVAHGSRLGGTVSCVTNAFWARTPAITHSKLATLREAGLTGLAVSVSRFHQQFVPLQRARHALAIAAELGIETELKGAVTLRDLDVDGVRSEWQQTLSADLINIFPVLSQLRPGVTLPEDEYYREEGLPHHPCPGSAVRVDFNGTATSCCAPGSNESFLVIGDAHSMSLREIHRNFKERVKQKLLREVGPIHFARGAVAAGLGHHLRPRYAGPCDLCLHIRTDPELRRVAEQMCTAEEETASAGNRGCRAGLTT